MFLTMRECCARLDSSRIVRRLLIKKSTKTMATPMKKAYSRFVLLIRPSFVKRKRWFHSIFRFSFFSINLSITLLKKPARAENAGYEWIFRYLQSDYTLFNDSDEICTYVNSATTENPIFGYGTGIKLGDALENGLTVDYITDMDPFSGFAKTKYVYIRSNTDNPAAARLFTIFSLGGEDAQGAGYDAYVNRMGCYPTRSSRDELLYNANHPFETVNSLPTNLEYVYENYVDVQDFFEYYASEFQ